MLFDTRARIMPLCVPPFSSPGVFCFALGFDFGGRRAKLPPCVVNCGGKERGKAEPHRPWKLVLLCALEMTREGGFVYFLLGLIRKFLIAETVLSQ